MFFTQYEKYIKSRDVLEEAYHTNKHKSELLFAIFQDYSDAENLFNLYSIDYNTQHFENYKLKLDTIKTQLDDLLMPEIPGWELLKITKERKLSTYVFAVTSDPDIAAKYAFDGVLSKPFKAQELKNAVFEIHSKT